MKCASDGEKALSGSRASLAPPGDHQPFAAISDAVAQLCQILTSLAYGNCFRYGRRLASDSKERSNSAQTKHLLLKRPVLRAMAASKARSVTRMMWSRMKSQEDRGSLVVRMLIHP